MKKKQLIYECQTHRLLTEQWNLLTEAQRSDIILFERELGPLYRQLHEALGAELTADQVDALFKKAEQVTSGDKTFAGKALGGLGAAAKLPFEVTAKINKKMDDLFKEKIKTMKPVQNFDAAFNKLKENIVSKTGGKDGNVMKSVEAYRNFAKKHPVVQSLIIAALTTLASFIGGPLGGAIASFGLRSIDRLLKGEDISDVLYKGIKSAAVGALIGLGVRKLVEFVKGMSVELNPPVQVNNSSLQSVMVQIDSKNPEIQAALAKAGLLNDSRVIEMCTHDPKLAAKFAEQASQFKALANNITSPEAVQQITEKLDQLKATAEESMKGWEVIFEKTKDYLLDPNKNALLAQKGITSKISYERFEELMKNDHTDTFTKTAKLLKTHGVDHMWSKFHVDTSHFVPTENFAKTTAQVMKSLESSVGTGMTGNFEVQLGLNGNPLAISEFLTTASTLQNIDVTQMANSIVNAQKMANAFDAIGDAVQAAAQGATAGSDTAQDNKKDAENDQIPDFTNESLMLSEIYRNMQREAYDPKTGNYNSLPDETTGFTGLGDKLKNAAKGAWDKTKSAASSAASAVGTTAKNVTQKITYDKLMKAWTAAGKPLQTAKVLDVMKKAGMSDEQIDAVQSDKPAEKEAPKPSREEKVKKFAEYIKRKKLGNAVKAYLNTTTAPEKKSEPASPEKPRGNDFLNPISESRKYRKWK